jgi:hypothetical protein
MPTDPRPAPLTAAQREIAMIRVVLEARGWTVLDARQEGDTLRLIANRTFTTEPMNLANMRDL